MRIAGDEYDAAASVLLEIDFDYLLRWGHAHLVARLHERLQGRLTDKELKMSSLTNLGNCYYSLGEYRPAIDYQEQALAILREIGDRKGEGAVLGNLEICYEWLGEYRHAIDYQVQSLAIRREIGDRQGEGNTLGNLGICYKFLGEYSRVIDYHEQSLAIAREIGYPYLEANELTTLGELDTATGQLAEARKHFADAGRARINHQPKISLA